MRERTRLGLRYFVQETPDERGEPYDRNRIAEDIAEQIRETIEALHKNRAVRASLRHAAVDHVRITIADLERDARNRKGGGLPALDGPVKTAIQDFVATHHRDLVAHIDQRIRDSRPRLRAVVDAGQRLRAFED